VASIEVDHIGDLESSLRDGVLCVILRGLSPTATLMRRYATADVVSFDRGLSPTTTITRSLRDVGTLAPSARRINAHCRLRSHGRNVT